MSNTTPRLTPRGPEGVPVDAPGNDGPAISPHAVSRMHRAENDSDALQNSPEFTDQPAVLEPRGRTLEPPASSASATNAHPEPQADSEDPKLGEPNPSHDTHKSPEERPRGLGDGELMEQPNSVTEAREPGPK